MVSLGNFWRFTSTTWNFSRFNHWDVNSATNRENRGLPIILVSTLLGGILASGGILQRQFKLPDATILVFQGLVFIVILFSESLYGKFKIFREQAA